MKNGLFTIMLCEKDHGGSEMSIHNLHQFECLLSPANEIGQRNQGKAARTGNSLKRHLPSG